MTRRIAIAILLTVWSMLIIIGVGVYFGTHITLIADLDDSIVSRAEALTDALDGDGERIVPTPPAGDRYVVRNAVGRTIARPITGMIVPPTVISRVFSTLADGSRVRTLTLDVRKTSTTQPSGATRITYSSSADRFDRLMNRLAAWMAGIGLIAGATASAVAVKVSRVSLRPLLKTAEQIGDIDERRLDRRISTADLPVELQPMAERLNDMLMRLERAFNDRKRFIADASHDLRTPVAALMTTLEVALRRPRDVPALQETLQSCLTDARSLRNLVDRLMQQVRSESATAAEQPQRFVLSAVIEQCVDSLIRSREAATVQVLRDLQPGLILETEIGRVRSIVTNLVANAFEYTPAGGWIKVKCELSNEIILTVSDSGTGISPELLLRVFEPFFRGDQPRSAAEGHLGLGLSIVQAHVRALGGRCEIHSPAGTGATFQIHLPTRLLAAAEREMVAK